MSAGYLLEVAFLCFRSWQGLDGQVAFEVVRGMGREGDETGRRRPALGPREASQTVKVKASSRAAPSYLSPCSITVKSNYRHVSSRRGATLLSHRISQTLHAQVCVEWRVSW